MIPLVVTHQGSERCVIPLMKAGYILLYFCLFLSPRNKDLSLKNPFCLSCNPLFSPTFLFDHKLPLKKSFLCFCALLAFNTCLLAKAKVHIITLPMSCIWGESRQYGLRDSAESNAVSPRGCLLSSGFGSQDLRIIISLNK